MIYLGIDPGQKGGIAEINGPFIKAFKYSDETLIELIQDHAEVHPILSKHVTVWVEKVHSMPRDGHQAAFKFGCNYGKILGILKAYNLEPNLVDPSVWKKSIGVTKDKQSSIDKAKQLFPGVSLLPTPRCKVDSDGMAEALLIAEYGKRHDAI